MFISSFVVLQAENHLNEDFPPLSLQSKALQSCSCAVEFTTRPSQHSPKVTLLHRQFFPFFLTKSFRGFSSTIDWSLMTFKKTTNQTAGEIEGNFLISRNSFRCNVAFSLMCNSHFFFPFLAHVCRSILYIHYD